MHSQDQQQEISAAVVEAARLEKPLQVTGSNSKAFYGNIVENLQPISIKQHRGIVDYDPAELFITARGGTPLKEIETELAKHHQMLPFEPPHYGEHATIGGSIACGFSGPRRPYSGAARDCILGTHIINGDGDYLQFGGQVMKNVAGYDVSRSMCGALGTLGIIMQVSLRVLPVPKQEVTIKISNLASANETIKLLKFAFLSNSPVSASFADNNCVYLRLTSTLQLAEQIFNQYELEELQHADKFWLAIKEHQHPFFTSGDNLWRISVPNNTPPLPLQGESVLEWNGGLRWLKTSQQEVHQIVQQQQGHAVLFKTKEKVINRFPALPKELQQLHLNLKQAFDPKGLLNPGRMYSWC